MRASRNRHSSEELSGNLRSRDDARPAGAGSGNSHRLDQDRPPQNHFQNMSRRRDILCGRSPRRVSCHRDLQASIFWGNFDAVGLPVAPSIQSNGKPENARKINRKLSICYRQTAQRFMTTLR